MSERAGNYDWLVLLADDSAIQVPAEMMAVESGALVFTSKHGYPTLALAPGEWKQAAVMSQLSGYQNAFSAAEAPEKKAKL